jgi:diadenosine tetraphosphate (Ap4A) HIT family hydrolase
MADMRMDNARTPEQVERMRKLKESGACFFCHENYLAVGASPAVFETFYWYVKKNDYPYPGSTIHYLVVSKKHVREIMEISLLSWIFLLLCLWWLKTTLKTSGESIFVRSGDMAFTGATLDHLHFHFLVGVPKPEEGTVQEINILVTLGHKNKDPESA